MIDVGARLSKIHQTGYWRVNIRPTRFVARMVPSLTECWRLVEGSKVMLRGWDYPHVDERENANGQDWIQSGIDWEGHGHIELWRFYQSGQFLHHFAAIEDFHKLPGWSSEGKPERYLLYVSTLYTTSEVFEFAARLAARDVLEPKGYLSIKLGNMGGRELAGWSLDDGIPRGYVSHIDEIEFYGSYTQETLMTRPAELALDAALQLFERFGWTDAPREWLAGWQRKLVERRLLR